MTTAEILKDLKANGSESIKKVLIKHGAKEPFYGVKVEHLKKIQKKIKKDHKLALELYDTGISDAMYLAGMIADENEMTKKEIQRWADKAYWSMLSEFTVAWVAAESKFGMELALEWIESKKEHIACSGWATLADLVSLKEDKDLDLKKIKSLLERVEKTIHKSPNRVRHCMNGFVIAVGGYVPALSANAIAAAKKVGIVSVEMGGTACKVPFAPDYIEKMKSKGTLTKKKKTVRC